MIEVRNITVQTRAGLALLKDLSVTFPPGKIHAIIGPNGSGKTTLIKAISGLTRPSSGDVLINGQKVHTRSPIEIASQLSYVEAEHHTPFAYTVMDTVLWGRWPQHQGHPRQTDYDAARVAAGRLGLSAMINRTMTTLSLGERKKTHLAKSLASESPYLVWDEPLAPLDIRASLEVMATLKDLASEGATVLISLHDITLAPRYADTITILDDKKVTWHGSPGDSVCLSTLAKVFGVRVDRVDKDTAWTISLTPT